MLSIYISVNYFCSLVLLRIKWKKAKKKHIKHDGKHTKKHKQKTLFFAGGLDVPRGLNSSNCTLLRNKQVSEKQYWFILFVVSCNQWFPNICWQNIMLSNICYRYNRFFNLTMWTMYCEQTSFKVNRIKLTTLLIVTVMLCG